MPRVPTVPTISRGRAGRRRGAPLVAALAASLIVLAGAPASAADDHDGHDNRVTMCHATSAGHWVRITVSASAAVAGHAHHTNDIIPAFSLQQGHHGTFFNGKNLGALRGYPVTGRQVLANGCRLPGGSTPSTTPAVTVSVPEGLTSTTAETDPPTTVAETDAPVATTAETDAPKPTSTPPGSTVAETDAPTPTATIAPPTPTKPPSATTAKPTPTATPPKPTAAPTTAGATTSTAAPGPNPTSATTAKPTATPTTAGASATTAAPGPNPTSATTAKPTTPTAAPTTTRVPTGSTATPTPTAKPPTPTGAPTTAGASATTAAPGPNPTSATTAKPTTPTAAPTTTRVPTGSTATPTPTAKPPTPTGAPTTAGATTSTAAPGPNPSSPTTAKPPTPTAAPDTTLAPTGSTAVPSPTATPPTPTAVPTTGTTPVTDPVTGCAPGELAIDGDCFPVPDVQLPTVTDVPTWVPGTTGPVPVVECIDRAAGQVWFGYSFDGDAAVRVPAGDANRVADPAASPPELFSSGRHVFVFAVSADAATWTLAGTIASPDAGTPRCGTSSVDTAITSATDEPTTVPTSASTGSTDSTDASSTSAPATTEPPLLPGVTLPPVVDTGGCATAQALVNGRCVGVKPPEIVVVDNVVGCDGRGVVEFAMFNANDFRLAPDKVTYDLFPARGEGADGAEFVSADLVSSRTGRVGAIFVATYVGVVTWTVDVAGASASVTASAESARTLASCPNAVTEVVGVDGGTTKPMPGTGSDALAMTLAAAGFLAVGLALVGVVAASRRRVHLAPADVAMPDGPGRRRWVDLGGRHVGA